MHNYPGLVDPIQRATKSIPGLMSKPLTQQFERLLREPLQGLKLEDQDRVATAVIAIDALDECENEQDVQCILRSLPLLQDASPLKLRVFLMSRPELPIRQAFADIPNRSFRDFVLHERISKDSTEHDISLYLRDQFAKIRKSRGLPQSWPRDEDLQTLVTVSVLLFVSAATLCRFTGDPLWQPAVRLAEVLKNQSKYATKTEKTYLPILEPLLAGQDQTTPLEYPHRCYPADFQIQVPRPEQPRFSPDCRRLATWSCAIRDATIRVWDIASGALLQKIDDFADTTYTLAFSACGTLLASGSADCTIRLWDIASNGPPPR